MLYFYIYTKKQRNQLSKNKKRYVVDYPSLLWYYNKSYIENTKLADMNFAFF